MKKFLTASSSDNVDRSNANTSAARAWVGLPNLPAVRAIPRPSLRSIRNKNASKKKAKAASFLVIDGSDRTEDTTLASEEAALVPCGAVVLDRRSSNYNGGDGGFTKRSSAGSSSTATPSSGQSSHPPSPPSPATLVRWSSFESRNDGRSRSGRSRSTATPPPGRGIVRRSRSSSNSSARHSVIQQQQLGQRQLSAGQDERRSRSHSRSSRGASQSRSQSRRPSSESRSRSKSTSRRPSTSRARSDRGVSWSDEVSPPHHHRHREGNGGIRSDRRTTFEDVPCKEGHCPRHPYVELRRYSERTKAWRTFLDSCPVCGADDAAGGGRGASDAAEEEEDGSCWRSDAAIAAPRIGRCGGSNGSGGHGRQRSGSRSGPSPSSYHRAEQRRSSLRHVPVPSSRGPV